MAKRYDPEVLSEILGNAKRQSTQESFEKSKLFINGAIDAYSKSDMVKKARFAFLVPTRISVGDETYLDEAGRLMPIVESMPHDQLYELLTNLPPVAFDNYVDENGHFLGVVVYVPILESMVSRYRSNLLLLRELRARINDALSFVERKYSADYVGLGGMLPKITNYGKSCRTSAVLTTGHSGTVAILCAYIEEELRRRKTNTKVGFIGGGSIGFAALDYISEIHTDLSCQFFDKRPKVNKSNYNKLSSRGANIKIAKSNDLLINDCDIVVSAITSKAPTAVSSYKSKTVIDDSQPASFSNDVKSKGGRLTWVVASTRDKLSFSRQSDYNYGKTGLLEKTDMWGCEAEVATISLKDRSDLATCRPIVNRDIRYISEQFTQLGVSISKAQSFGKLANHK